MRYLCIITAALLLAGSAFAADIVSMPTANQMKAGEFDAAAYYFGLDNPSAAPQYVQLQTLYVGLTDRFEIDVHHANVDKDEDSTILVGSFKLLSETQVKPDLVIGCRNIGGTATALDNPGTGLNERTKSEKRSYFLSAAKTFFFNPLIPGPPLVRVHLSLGTEDWTLFGQKRHQGIFGGLQFLFRPELGLIVQNDGQDLITGLSIMPKNSGLTIKGGTYGDHWWTGIAYNKAINL
ncbi:MAG: hypothetical protein M1133_01460 [Armatimonadetes bacterium]|nr:hypothetical protein [Armatimonadota bacterium]